MWLPPGMVGQVRRNHEAALAARAEVTRRVRSARAAEPELGSEAAAAHATHPPFRDMLTTDEVASAAGGAPAARAGGVIEVGGTTALGPDGRILYPGDPYRQTQAALRRLGDTLAAMGASLDQVVRTRIYLKKTWQATDVARAHADAFAQARPATTFVGAGSLIDPDALVEIEATAHVG